MKVKIRVRKRWVGWTAVATGTDRIDFNETPMFWRRTREAAIRRAARWARPSKAKDDFVELEL